MNTWWLPGALVSIKCELDFFNAGASDNQQALEEGHYIRITLSKKREDDHVYQLFQSGRNVYKTVNMNYAERAHIEGDYDIKKGEYKLIITGFSVEEVKFTFDRY